MLRFSRPHFIFCARIRAIHRYVLAVTLRSSPRVMHCLGSLDIESSERRLSPRGRTRCSNIFLTICAEVAVNHEWGHQKSSAHRSYPESSPFFRSYYELAAATLRFNFPNPGPLDGITSTTKNILTMKNCGFQYPGSPKPQIQGASLKLCLASRVGVTGVNGAGKTTLIKMVVRETEPREGEVRSSSSHHRSALKCGTQHVS